MILERLTLHNFGVFRGRHTFELEPAPGKPVVLFVGLNGAGKTTLLHALQLAFYGAQAPDVERAGEVGGYTLEDYLGDCINYGPPPADSASIEVEFRAVRGGEEHHYLLRRSWRRGGKAEAIAGHRVELFLDGRPDPALSATWTELVEELLPLRLSSLFFFDGEKINEWADWNNATDLITDAIQALLGLDVLDRTIADLEAVERRAAAEAAPTEQQIALEEARAKAAAHEAGWQAALAQLRESESALKRAETEQRLLEAQLTARGLPLLDRRAELLALRDAARAKLDAAREAERRRRLEAERARHERQRWSDLLRRRHTAMLAEAPEAMREWIDGWIRKHVADGTWRKPGEERAFAADDDPADIALLGRKLKEHEALLARMPSEMAASDMLSRRNAGLREMERAGLRLEDRQTDARQRETEWRLSAATANRLEQGARAVLVLAGNAVRQQAVGHAALEALRGFRLIMVERHLAEIGNRTTRNFRLLLHKDEIFDSVRLLARTDRHGHLRFRPELHLAGHTLSPDDLSAGESQLLAFALRWALAQASGRRVPLMIDTPLARLDQVHRQKVAVSYLPFAAAQVIVLATDSEAAALVDCSIRQTIVAKVAPAASA